MSSFASIDEALRRWAVENKLYVATEYKECEERSFELATRFGSVQVWIEPGASGIFEVVGCNNRTGAARRLERVAIAGAGVGPALDHILAFVRKWEW